MALLRIESLSLCQSADGGDVGDDGDDADAGDDLVTPSTES